MESRVCQISQKSWGICIQSFIEIEENMENIFEHYWAFLESYRSADDENFLSINFSNVSTPVVVQQFSANAYGAASASDAAYQHESYRQSSSSNTLARELNCTGKAPGYYYFKPCEPSFIICSQYGSTPIRQNCPSDLKFDPGSASCQPSHMCGVKRYVKSTQFLYYYISSSSAHTNLPVLLMNFHQTQQNRI